MACSLFLGIWRCIVGVDDDNQEEEILPYYDTPPRSYVPTATNSTTATTCHLLRKPSGAYTTTTASCAYAPTPSYSDSWNSAQTKLPATLNIYSVPKAAIHSSVATRPDASIRTPSKSHDACAQKPKILAPPPLPTPNKSHEAAAQKTNKVAPSPFPADFSLKREAVVDHVNDETSARTLPSELSSSFSQPLPSLTKSVASSSSEWLAPCSRTSSPVPKRAPSPVLPSSSSCFGNPLSLPKPRQPSSEPLASLVPSNPTNLNSKTTKVQVEKDASYIFMLASSSETLPFVSTPPTVSSLPSAVSLTELLAPCSRILPPVSTPPPPPVSPSSSFLGRPPSTPQPQRPSSKPLFPPAPSNPTNPNSKATKVWVEKDPSSVYSRTSSARTLPSVSTPPPPPPPVSPLSSSSSSSGTPPSTPKPRRPSSKPLLSPAPPNPTNTNSKTRYVWVKKDTSSVYAIPKDFKDLIKNDVVPEILERPLSPSTYKDYFEALLYAEDFYLEIWDNFEMENVTLELEEASIYKRKGKYNKKNVDDEKDDKLFVTFELDSIPERRPFLLSRDFVFVSPSGTTAEPLQGLIYRVVKSNRVLVEFGKDFHAQHYKACEYDVKFSFNRVCLKRAHQAVATVSGPLFRNLLFPDSVPKNRFLTAQLQSITSNLDSYQISAVRHILSHQIAVPYLVEGPITKNASDSLSRTGIVVREAVLKLYQTSPSCRILICAPANKVCDIITRSFKGKIPESGIFRANAAFRELHEVPEDILASCLYKMESDCFSCHSIHELQKFNVISSTYMSSFRLHNEGIMAGHFSHIFLVDASSIIEPEAMVPLANLSNESTVVTVTGERGDHSRWIRSPIARQNGLLISYFERLRQSKLYDSLDSKVITVL